mgnify:CR=1 FL=1
MYKIEIAKESRRKKEMKKKFVVALVVAMSLTVAGTGTVFAMDKVSAIASEKEHVHGDNCEWVVDRKRGRKLFTTKQNTRLFIMKLKDIMKTTSTSRY